KLTLSATHKGGTETVAEGDTKSGDTGVGISVAVTVAQDSVLAQTARNIDATDAVTIQTSSASANESRAVASVAGGQTTPTKTAEDPGGKKGVDNTVAKQTEHADKRATDAGGDTKATGKTDKASSDTSSGPVQVAGAVGVT